MVLWGWVLEIFQCQPYWHKKDWLETHFRFVLIIMVLGESSLGTMVLPPSKQHNFCPYLANCKRFINQLSAKTILPLLFSWMIYITIITIINKPSIPCLSAAYFIGVESFCVGSSCLQRSGFQALVDSGSSFTYLPAEVYKKIVFEVILQRKDVSYFNWEWPKVSHYLMQFDKQVKFNATRIVLQELPWNYCYNLR